MSSRAITNAPPRLYEALKAEGFELPKECGDVTLVMPVDGVYQLHYVVNLTSEDLSAIGRALARIGQREKVLTESISTSYGDGR